MQRTFAGGVHPPEFKELAHDKPITRVEYPSRVVLPLAQHAGAPAKPLVQAKDRVRRGQRIGEAAGFVSAHIHSPVTGTVVAVKQHRTAVGARALSIIIDVEGLDDEERLETPENPTPGDIRRIVQEAGIVGLGGAAFPTHVKLSPPEDNPIDTVILNGCECEPYLTLDHRLMVERPARIIEGLLLLKEAVGAKRAFVGIEDNKPDAIAAMRAHASAADSIEVVALPTKYPQGSEKHLIKAILGREVPSGGLPFHVGVLVQNVQTAFAVARAVREGVPLIERVVTVSGQAAVSPGNFEVPIGMLGSDLVAQAGGFTNDVAKVIFGGPMTGFAVGDLAVPITKGTSGIVALPASMVDPFPEEDICIRCGRCVDVCPARLTPNELGTYGRLGMTEKALGIGLFDCIECGSCAYICPAHRNLIQYIRLAKARAREMK